MHQQTPHGKWGNLRDVVVLDKEVEDCFLGAFGSWFVFWENRGWLLEVVAAKISDELVHIWRVCIVMPLGELYGLVKVRIMFVCWF